MTTRFTAAAQAIADHFKQAEIARCEPFADTFLNPMNNDAVTPNFVGIPVALLRAMTNTEERPLFPVPVPMRVVLKSAFLLCLAALIESLDAEIEALAIARWTAWVGEELESIPEEMEADYAIDSAIAFFNDASPAQGARIVSDHDLLEIGAKYSTANNFDRSFTEQGYLECCRAIAAISGKGATA